MQFTEPTLQALEAKPMLFSVPSSADTSATNSQARSSFAALAHDVRNMLSALDLYCELVSEPGVLSPEYQHYGSELKMVVVSSRRLVERMNILGLDSLPAEQEAALPANEKARPAVLESLLPSSLAHTHANWCELPEVLIDDIAAELRSCENLLIALAGSSSITVSFDIRECSLPVQMTGEALIRILVNLVRNASEAMTSNGRIRIGLRELPTETGTSRWLALTVEDNGPGIPRDALDLIFEPGYTTRGVGHEGSTPGPWQATHRGLGLSIVRSIVKGAGGCINAAARDPSGACFQVELPVRSSF